MQQSGRALAALLPLLSAVAAHRRPFHLGRHRDAPSASASGCDTPGFVECPAGSASAGICVPALSPWCALLPYLNPYADDGVRVADLLPRLTLAQKVNLMQTTPVANNAVPDLAILQYGTAECLHGYCGETNKHGRTAHGVVIVVEVNGSKSRARIASVVGERLAEFLRSDGHPGLVPLVPLIPCEPLAVGVL